MFAFRSGILIFFLLANLQSALSVRDGVPRFLYFLESAPDQAYTLEDLKDKGKSPKNAFVYIHGWNSESLEDAGSVDFKDFLLKDHKGVDMVLLVDWTPNVGKTTYPHYKEKVAPVVARATATELIRLNDNLNIPPSKVRKAAHSLGTHIMGWTGRELADQGYGKVQLALALDPSNFVANGLRANDAEEVVVIHTTGTFGSPKKRGRKDLYYSFQSHEGMDKECPSEYFGEVCRHRYAKTLGKDYLAGRLPLPLNENSEQNLDRSSQVPPGSKKKIVTIFVLDYSASMQPRYTGHDRIGNLISSVKQQIRNIPLNSTVAIVVFGGTAHIMAGLTTVVNDATRDKLIASIPGRDTELFWTSIGAGLRAAISLLPANHCAHIILITDGDENKPPTLSEVEPSIPSCTCISSIAMGGSADKQMEGLSKRHCGVMDSVRDGQTADKLVDAFAHAYDAHLPESQRTIRFPRKTLDLDSSSGVSYRVDQGATKDLRFQILSRDGKKLSRSVDVVSPTGAVLNNVCAEGELSITCNVPNAAAGVWTIKGSNRRHKRDTIATPGKTAFVILTSKQDLSLSTEPVRLYARLNNSLINYQAAEPVMIEALLSKGSGKVIGANVTAIIYSPDGNISKISLLDNGIGADDQENDGIYSRLITLSLKINVRYEVYVSANCEDRECRLRPGDSNWFVPPTTVEKDGFERLEGFEREGLAGSIRATSAYQALPPSRVNDLQVISYDAMDRLVSLRWTASSEAGDSDEKASCLEVSYGMEFHKNARGHGLTPLNGTWLKSGTLTPGSSRNLQKLIVTVPEEVWTDAEEGYNLTFAARYCNKEGTFGKYSNIVRLTDVLIGDEEHGNIAFKVVLILFVTGMCTILVYVLMNLAHKKGYLQTNFFRYVFRK